MLLVVAFDGLDRVEPRGGVAQRESQVVKGDLDLEDRLGTEVADVEEVLLGTGDELTDGVDALAFEAVVGTKVLRVRK